MNWSFDALHRVVDHESLSEETTTSILLENLYFEIQFAQVVNELAFTSSDFIGYVKFGRKT